MNKRIAIPQITRDPHILNFDFEFSLPVIHFTIDLVPILQIKFLLSSTSKHWQLLKPSLGS